MKTLACNAWLNRTACWHKSYVDKAGYCQRAYSTRLVHKNMVGDLTWPVKKCGCKSWLETGTASYLRQICKPLPF